MADSPERREAKKPIREGVIFFVYRNGMVLVEERPEDDPGYGGYIIIPGGKCEEGESIEQALIREMKEELGAQPLSWVHLDTFEHVSLNGNHYLSHACLVLELEGEVQNKELHKGKQMWVSIEEAAGLLKLESSRLILSKAREAILAKQKED